MAEDYGFRGIELLTQVTLPAIAPQVIRHNVIAQEIVREMLARGSRRQTTALSMLAQRAGLLE